PGRALPGVSVPAGLARPACPAPEGRALSPGTGSSAGLRPQHPWPPPAPPSLGRSLASPDPPHGPGYAGYCPRHKFSLGTPYGQLPSSPEVAGSSQLVLQPARWPCAGAPPVGQGEALLGTRPACWGAGAHPLGCCVIPGYTGFIPRAQNLFAKTYSEICKEARSDFARQQLRAAGKEQELQNAGRLPQCTKGKVSVTRATWHLSAAPP
uniref:Ciliary microtubule inner protein 2B n=1 Tax=Chrysemys picta bellii TaxID=8478 RepID=A0A8C3IIC7_CHRPI